jgi:hypothetical protein
MSSKVAVRNSCGGLWAWQRIALLAVLIPATAAQMVTWRRIFLGQKAPPFPKALPIMACPGAKSPKRSPDYGPLALAS